MVLLTEFNMPAQSANPAESAPPREAPDFVATEPLVLYDGVCGLCDHLIQFLLRIDRHGRLHFAPLQGSTAASFVRSGLIDPDIDSVVYINATESGTPQAWTRSDAVVRVLVDLGWPWAAFGIFRWVPRFIRDTAYAGVAQVRYRIFGRYDVCKLPTPETRARFRD